MNYFGNGDGRDSYIICQNGGLSYPEKVGMRHTGVSFNKYNGPARHRSPSPFKPAATFYYQSDGTGRDSYVLQNNGGSRIEHKNRQNGDPLFYDSLRSNQKSPLKSYFDPVEDRAEITTYLNWPSLESRKMKSRTIKK